MTEVRFQPPPVVPGALRLHLNENTGGCSPAVLDAIRAVGAEAISLYPDYTALTRACAAYVGVDESRLMLSNGLDEALLCAVVAAFRPDGTGGIPEGIIVLPAFEMYAIQIRAVGGRVVAVPAGDDFAFPTEALLAAVTPRTRIVFLTNPNNPTGLFVPPEALDRIARGVPPEMTVVVDEAYYEFSGVTLVPELAAWPNVVVGRTFAKAHGLAGVRAGCLVGDPARLDPIRNVVPPFSVSVLTAAAWMAALADGPHLARYQAEVEASKALVYAACDRLRLRYWPSGGNFVLIRVGDRAAVLVNALARQGILIKDRSGEHGCAGCVRLTAGVLAHTRRAIEAMETFLCAAA